MKKNLLLNIGLILMFLLGSCQKKTLVHKKTYKTCNTLYQTKTNLKIKLKKDSTYSIVSKSRRPHEKDSLNIITEEGFYRTINDTTFLNSEILGRKLYLVDKKYLMDESFMEIFERNNENKREILKSGGFVYKLK